MEVSTAATLHRVTFLVTDGTNFPMDTTKANGKMEPTMALAVSNMWMEDHTLGVSLKARPMAMAKKETPMEPSEEEFGTKEISLVASNRFVLAKSHIGDLYTVVASTEFCSLALENVLQ